MKKIKSVVWRKNLNLSKIKPGTMIKGVPIGHEMFKVPIARGLKMCRVDWRIWKRVNEMLQYEKKLPIYYCLKCGQIEDGRHRITGAKVYGTKKLDILLWSGCYKKNREAMQAFDNRFISGELTL